MHAIHPLIYLFIHPSIHQSINPSIYPMQSIHSSINPSIHYPKISHFIYSYMALDTRLRKRAVVSSLATLLHPVIHPSLPSSLLFSSSFFSIPSSIHLSIHSAIKPFILLFIHPCINQSVTSRAGLKFFLAWLQLHPSTFAKVHICKKNQIEFATLMWLIVCKNLFF